jgi:hypothetical protein
MVLADVLGLTTDDLMVVLTTAQLIVVVFSLLYLGRQVRGERVAAGFAAYSQVNDAYTTHLWRAVEDPTLDAVWDPWDPEREAALAEAQRSGTWGAWHAMTADERRCYRFTRAALEIFEQAWEVRRRDMIGADTWGKWEAWITTWTRSRYFAIVFEDVRPRLIEEFALRVEAAARPS